MANMTERTKQAIIEQLWLTYYNDTLFSKGLITEEQRNKMSVRIKSRTSALIKQKANRKQVKNA